MHMHMHMHMHNHMHMHMHVPRIATELSDAHGLAAQGAQIASSAWTLHHRAARAAS